VRVLYSTDVQSEQPLSHLQEMQPELTIQSPT
jgi:hypothetical protein